MKFQSLKGLILTHLFQIRMLTHLLVSIPQRSDFNATMFSNLYSFIKLFQSLKGLILTPSPNRGPCGVVAFQSLKGLILTEKRRKKNLKKKGCFNPSKV